MMDGKAHTCGRSSALKANIGWSAGKTSQLSDGYFILALV